jgi:hypothetical protein
MKLVKARYMHVWKYHNKIPFVQLKKKNYSHLEQMKEEDPHPLQVP